MSNSKTLSSSIKTPRSIKLPRHRLRTLASTLQRYHRPPPPPLPPNSPITVVCISDTHCTQPPVPAGDLLLHAGDLSVWGTYGEIQAQLKWLSQQPHRYKVVIAGNHDLLLDPEFQRQYPEKWKQAMKATLCSGDGKDEARTAEDLEWGDLIYLHNSKATLNFDGNRQITIYGSPLTPQYGLSAFQHAPTTDVWSGIVPQNTDILLTHGPPRGHLDGVKKSGCADMAQEVASKRPRLVVFGHIHVGCGVEERVYDTVGQAHEDILTQGGDYGSAARMAVGVVWGWMVPRRWRGRQKVTTFVNASVVQGWEDHVVKNEAVVVSI